MHLLEVQPLGLHKASEQSKTQRYKSFLEAALGGLVPARPWEALAHLALWGAGRPGLGRPCPGKLYAAWIWCQAASAHVYGQQFRVEVRV